MARSVRLGAKVPNSGPLPAALGIGPMAERLEQAGFDSLWCSDHIVMPERSESVYPFSDDHRPSWPMDMPWYDAVVTMALMAGATQRAEIGVAVLVLPLRHPVTFAKEIASLDALSAGRTALGVGAGWLAEEFEALGVPFGVRGARMEEWITLLRACWTGTPPPFEGEHYRLPAGVLCYPTPAREVPVLVGGTSGPALRRAARRGNGWLGLQRAARIDAEELASHVATLHREARAAGRDPGALRTPLRIIETAGEAERVAATLPALAAAGIDEVIVDVDWSGQGDAERVHAVLREAAGG
jgi:probable F420-dependent oxidoreductase